MGEGEKQKQVRYLEIFNLEDLYSDQTHEILHEAIMIDEMLSKGRRNLKMMKKH